MPSLVDESGSAWSVHCCMGGVREETPGAHLLRPLITGAVGPSCPPSATRPPKSRRTGPRFMLHLYKTQFSGEVTIECCGGASHVTRTTPVVGRLGGGGQLTPIHPHRHTCSAWHPQKVAASGGLNAAVGKTVLNLPSSSLVKHPSAAQCEPQLGGL